MNVPFVDLKIQYNYIKAEIAAVIQSVLDATAFVGGRFVEEFERAFSKQYEVKHSISCGNGTDALYISMKALGIGPGDEVITASNSWISTSETISQTGATPVFVDIEPDFYCIDADLVEQKIKENTKAIIPVHLYGHPADISKIKDICEKHELFLLEDCAQAHFASFKGKKVGTFGIAGTFSFYPGKNLGAYGDAGAIISNNDEFATKAFMFANHGSLQKHKHEIEGINSRMDGIQAAVLNVKLKYINKWNSARHNNALYYNKLLADLPDVITPKIHKDANPIFHLYVIRIKQRDELANFLKSKEIGTGIHYPTALPFMLAYNYLGHQPSDFPIAFQYQNEILSLPMYPELTQDQMEFVVNTIKEFYDR